MAAWGLCQPVTAVLSVFSHFSVFSVLRFCGRKNKVKGFNTEGTEKGEGTEKSSHYGSPERGRTELFGSFGVENHGDWAYEIEYGETRANGKLHSRESVD
jgi:hypothetical protein